MKISLMALFLLIISVAPGAQAQDISAEPICFELINEAPYRVYGTFNTDLYTRPDGKRARHRSNFRLDPPGAVHKTEGHPLDRAEFCSYGPFYPGGKLELTIRTLVPVFACQTRIDQGPIVISGYRKPEGGAVTTAACFD